MNCFIVEDSRLAREELKRLLNEETELTLIGEAESADEAVIALKKLKPLLVFMDINLNDKSGFDVLSLLDYQPYVIFTTAYDEFALRSFEFNTVDYLVKPIDKSAFKRSIDKVRNIIKETDSEDNNEALNEEHVFLSGHKVFIKDGEKCYFVKIEDIYMFEVSGPYTKVYFESGAPSVPRALNFIERRMDPELFFRANRNQIINLNSIEKVIPWFNHTLKVKLKNNVEVELSRRKSFEFKEKTSL